MFDAYRGGLLGAIPITRYALKDAARAHEDIAERRKTGSLVPLP